VTGASEVVFAAGAEAGSGAERKLTVDRDGAIKLLEAPDRSMCLAISWSARSAPERTPSSRRSMTCTDRVLRSE
jgi:hypothetical protein